MSRGFSCLRWCVVACCLLLSTRVNAHPDLDEATRAYAQGRMARALAALERAESSVTIQEADLVAARMLRGSVLLAMGRKPAAEAAFVALLRLRPLHEPNELDTPPDVRASFMEVQARFLREQGATVQAPSVEAPVVRAALGGAATEVADGVLYLKAPSQPAYTQVPMVRDASGAALVGRVDHPALWEAGARDGRWLMVVEARNARGVPWARAGSEAHALELPVTAQMAQAALAALAPPPPTPVAVVPAPPAAMPTAVTPVVTAEPAPSRPLAGVGLGLLVAGGAGVGVAVLAGLALTVAGVLSALGGGYAYQQLLVPGVEASGNKGLLSNVYRGGLAVALGSAGLVVLSALGGAAAAVLLSTGVVLRVL